MEGRRILVLQHVGEEHLGLIAEALSDRLIEPSYCCPYLGDSVPATLDGYQGVVLMGGPQSVYQDKEYPYLRAEKALVSRAIETNCSVLGVCLGSQILADVLGARVYPGQTFELGWKDVQVATNASEDPVFSGLPSQFRPFHWHGDIYDLPKGAILLGSSEATSVQGFSFNRRHYGFLCHLEITEKQIITMSGTFSDDLVRGNVDPSALLAETPGHVRALRENALGVFRRWADSL
jgi:GMP synthase (glutamine-hydrolysing)